MNFGAVRFKYVGPLVNRGGVCRAMNVSLGYGDTTADNINNASSSYHGFICPVDNKYIYIRYKH